MVSKKKYFWHKFLNDFKQLKTIQNKIDDVDLGNNRVCAEVVFSKSPHSFWVRLADTTDEFNQMITKLQVEYENAHES